MTAGTSKTTHTKKAKAQQAEQLAQQLGQLKLLGHVVTLGGRTDSSYNFAQVVQALKDAGLDHTMAREFLPTNAFSRACKKLGEDRVIDILKEEGTVITFQFTKKELKGEAEKEWEYNTETKLKLDRDTGHISCPLPHLRQKAQDELDKAMQARTNNDVTKIAIRLFEKGGNDIMPVPGATGVYFVPEHLAGFLHQVKTFLLKLGRQPHAFPVPAGVQDSDGDVQRTVEDYLRGMLADHYKSIEGFTLNTRKDTIELAAQRINHTRVRVEAYANYLGDKAKELLEGVQAAKGKLLQQVSALAEERASLPPGSGNGEVFGHAPTAVIRWMGKAGWSVPLAIAAFKGLGVTVAEGTVRAQLLAGRKGDRGDPAPITSEQAGELKKAAEKGGAANG